MSTNFAKTLVWKQDYDVKLWRHKQRTTNTNDYPISLNETRHENFLRTPLSQSYITTDCSLLDAKLWNATAILMLCTANTNQHTYSVFDKNKPS